ncbi:hypothetical protein GOP47_0024543 [Adiantum capillus-veneris]|uniref:Uncharacterized protein n=1 Tax=Adiantum capillus-veneris TaxID=13818 RepID=A0A9D4U343_ADICA|nr:hypothetical protein GOP47_0024543 [Adiantum capillus-veneris]
MRNSAICRYIFGIGAWLEGDQCCLTLEIELHVFPSIWAWTHQNCSLHQVVKTASEFGVSDPESFFKLSLIYQP